MLSTIHMCSSGLHQPGRLCSLWAWSLPKKCSQAVESSGKGPTSTDDHPLRLLNR